MSSSNDENEKDETINEKNFTKLNLIIEMTSIEQSNFVDFEFVIENEN